MRELICIICPNGCSLSAALTGGKWTVKGNLCPKGREFAINEITNPKRSIASTVRTVSVEQPRLPVRTEGEIPKSAIFPAMEELGRVLVDRPVCIGDTIVENICGTGINVIATADMHSA